MSRIDEALNRTGQANRSPEGSREETPERRRPVSALERYGDQESSTLEEAVRWSSAQRPSHGARESSQPAPDTDGEPLIDFRQLFQFGAFGARAVKRHPFLAIGTFVLVFGATAAAVQVWPKTYHVQAKLLAQRIGVMPAISNPGRAIPADADSPTRAAAEVILQRDNLLAMIRATDLLNQWQRTRPPLLRLKDRVFATFSGTPTEDERLDAMVGLLEKRLVVSVSLEDTIAIDLDWPDRQAAYALVKQAVDGFLDSRRLSETMTIDESVSILETSEASLQRDVDKTFAELQAAQAQRPRIERRRIAAPRPADPLPEAAAPPAAAADDDPEVAAAKSAFDEKQQELTKLEETRQQQVSQLRLQLTNALAVDTDNHPTVVGLRQSLASAEREPPQLVALRNETRTLRGRYEAARKGAEQRLADAAAPIAAAAAAARTRRAAVVDRDDEIVAEAESPLSDTANPLVMRMKSQLGQLADLRSRIASARIELATSAAAFKFRYALVNPPQLPRRPTKPNVAAVLLAGCLGALLLAIAAPIGVERIALGRIPPAREVPREIGLVQLRSEARRL